MSDLTIAIVGNPSGKTTLFNALTGTQQRVGNWPGVTVEKKVGQFVYKGKRVKIVDLPGVYSLSGAGGSTSLDEQIARDFILSGEPKLIVNIVDASNIERNLYLTAQLLEMGATVVVALNMVDIAKSRHIDIDAEALAKRLGCPVIPIVASAEKGIEALKAELIHTALDGLPSLRVRLLTGGRRGDRRTDAGCRNGEGGFLPLARHQARRKAKRRPSRPIRLRSRRRRATERRLKRGSAPTPTRWLRADAMTS